MSQPIPPGVLAVLEAMEPEVLREFVGMYRAVTRAPGIAAGTVRVFKDRAGTLRHTTVLEMSAAGYAEVGSGEGGST